MIDIPGAMDWQPPSVMHQASDMVLEASRNLLSTGVRTSFPGLELQEVENYFNPNATAPPDLFVTIETLLRRAPVWGSIGENAVVLTIHSGLDIVGWATPILSLGIGRTCLHIAHSLHVEKTSVTQASTSQAQAAPGPGLETGECKIIICQQTFNLNKLELELCRYLCK
jgi:hypothetical protein